MLNKSLVSLIAILMGLVVTSWAMADEAKTTDCTCTSSTCQTKACQADQACDAVCSESQVSATRSDGIRPVTVSDFFTTVDNVWKAAALTSNECIAARSDSAVDSGCNEACTAACACAKTVTCANPNSCTANGADKAACCTTAAATNNEVAVSDNNCEDKLTEGAKCVVRATLHGRFDGSTDKSIRLVISVPDETVHGVPILSDIPYCDRLFKNVGVGHKVIVLHLPKDEVEAIQSKEAGCEETHLAPVVVASEPATKPAKCASACGSAAVFKTVQQQKAATCQAAPSEPAQSRQAYQPTSVKDKPECHNGPSATQANPGVTHPKTAAVTVLPPVAFPVPAPYFQPPRPVSQYYAVHPAKPGCQCGAGSAYGPTHANNELPEWAHQMIRMATENAYLKARAELQDERMALHDELLHVHAENARLEAVQEQREELLETLVEASIEKAQLEAHVELMQEREALLTEIASLRGSQEANSKQGNIHALTAKLEHSRAQNTVLKARIAELEETVKAISQKVANQPSTIQVH